MKAKYFMLINSQLLLAKSVFNEVIDRNKEMEKRCFGKKNKNNF